MCAHPGRKLELFAEDGQIGNDDGREGDHAKERELADHLVEDARRERFVVRRERVLDLVQAVLDDDRDDHEHDERETVHAPLNVHAMVRRRARVARQVKHRVKALKLPPVVGWQGEAQLLLSKDLLDLLA